MHRINIKVITRAKKEGIEKISESDYKIKINTVPEKGKANKRIIEILSKYFDIKRQNIKIIKGKTSNKKVIEL